MKTSELKLNDKNPRKISKDKLEKLKQSIKDFEIMMAARPIVIDSNNIILGGNMRFTALKALGYKEIPDNWVYKMDDLTDEQKKEFIIKDNVGFGEWDWDILKFEFDEADLVNWGLEFPVDMIEETILEAEEDDYEEPENIEVDVVLGDLIEFECTDGRVHRLICGDSTDSDTVERLMNKEKADMVFTDPPYFSKQNLVRDASPKSLIKGSLNGQDSMFAKIYDFDENKVIQTLNTLFLFSEVNTYFCCSQEQVVFYLKYAENIDLKYNILVWRKPNNVINKERFSSSIEYIIRIYDIKNAGLNRLSNNNYYDKVKETSRYISKNEKVHHTQKPIELCSQFIELSSNISELLFEPFCGSGSTMVAAHQLKRKCYGMELDPKYCQVIIDRMQKLDSSIKVKINGTEYEQTKSNA